jgi:hypothetical protein
LDRFRFRNESGQPSRRRIETVLAYSDDFQLWQQVTQSDYEVQMSSVVVLALMLKMNPTSIEIPR